MCLSVYAIWLLSFRLPALILIEQYGRHALFQTIASSTNLIALFSTPHPQSKRFLVNPYLHTVIGLVYSWQALF